MTPNDHGSLPEESVEQAVQLIWNHHWTKPLQEAKQDEENWSDEVASVYRLARLILSLPR